MWSNTLPLNQLTKIIGHGPTGRSVYELKSVSKQTTRSSNRSRSSHSSRAIRIRDLENALAGKSGIARTTLFDLTDCPVTISGEVKNFDVTRAVGPFEPSPGNPITQAANAKTRGALGALFILHWLLDWKPMGIRVWI
jgi:hypothetical protein